jgi:hypothetical protein
LGLESKKQSGLALPCGIYQYLIAAFRIHVSPLQTSYARFGKMQGVEMTAAGSKTSRSIFHLLRLTLRVQPRSWQLYM